MKTLIGHYREAIKNTPAYVNYTNWKLNAPTGSKYVYFTGRYLAESFIGSYLGAIIADDSEPFGLRLHVKRNTVNKMHFDYMVVKIPIRTNVVYITRTLEAA